MKIDTRDLQGLILRHNAIIEPVSFESSQLQVTTRRVGEFDVKTFDTMAQVFRHLKEIR